MKKKQVLHSHSYNTKLLRKLHKRRFPSLRQFKHLSRLLTFPEKKLFKTAVIFLTVGVVWLGVVVIGTNRVQIPAVGGSYTEAVVGSPQLINPLFATLNDVDADLVNLIYSGLLRYDENQNLIGDLAQSYTLSEDQKTYTFKLKEGITWHDGQPFTASDVLFTFDMLVSPQVNSPLLVSFQGVQVSQIDDYTVVFTLAEPFSPFLSSLTVGILPEHVWGAIPPENIRLSQSNLRPIGTGPFRFSKLKKSEEGYLTDYELVRNENFYGQPPYIEEFALRFFSEYDGLGGAIQALREQKVEGLHFVPNDLKDKVERKHIVLHTLQLPQYTAAFFNRQSNEALEDADVRKALAMALDKRRVMRGAIGQDGEIIHGPILPGFPGFNMDIQKIEYSIEGANELLDADWERVSAQEYRDALKKERLEAFEDTLDDSVTSTEEILAEQEKEIEAALESELQRSQTFYRKSEDGEYLSIKLVTADTNEYRQAAQLIAGFWESVGVGVTLEYVPPRSMIREVLKGRNYDVLLYRIIMGSNPDLYPFWHSSQKASPGLNLSGFEKAEVDTLIESTREVSDPAELEEAYKQIEQTILDEIPAIFLYMPTYTYAMLDKVQGFQTQRIFTPSDRFSGVTSWYIKTKGQWNSSK